MLLAGCGFAGVYYLSKIPLPDAIAQAETSFVYASDGTLLAELHAEENRILVPFEARGDGSDYSDLPEHLIAAVVAREDRRFFEHRGVDLQGIARAAWNDIRNEPVQGGSTIPQQYVKNALLTNERSLVRKLKEATLAIKLSQEYSKDEIMSLYLNTIYLGRGAYGIEAAAQDYFGKTARDLTLNESAFLAGLISAPSSADPIDDPSEAIRRRDLAIDAMTETGYLDPGEAAAEKYLIDGNGQAQPRPVVALERVSQDVSTAGGSAYFTEYVRQELVRVYGEQEVYRGGLRVTTTLDPQIQESAERAATEILDEPDDPDVAIVTLDRDGRVRAMVGGRDFASSQVNLAVGTEGGGSGRQPGSTFKPVVLAAAFSQGTSPKQTYAAPSKITLDLPDGDVWKVSNAGDSSGGGSQNLVSATIGSINTVYAQLILDVGVQETIDMAHALGIKAALPAEPAIALGAGEVSPLDMATAFNTLANVGERADTSVLDRIAEADGALVYENPRTRTRVLDEGQAANVTAALQGVVDRGTGKAARIKGVPVAGKTGTTQDFGDAWFVGYTPQFTTSVWVGYMEGNERKLTDVHGEKVFGGGFPAEIWREHMARVMETVDDPGEFPDAPDVDNTGGTSTKKKGSGKGSDGDSTATTAPPESGTDPVSPPEPEQPPSGGGEAPPSMPPSGGEEGTDPGG